MSDTNKPNYQIGTVQASDIDTESDAFDFCVDTALSWDGRFPDPGIGDYLVTIAGLYEGETRTVLVSRRYTSAVSPEDAADIALDAFGERHGYEPTNDNDPTEYAVSRVDVVQADDPAVDAAKHLTRAALLDAARNGAALDTCDED